MDYLSIKSLLEAMRNIREIEGSNNICLSLEDIAKIWGQTVLLQKSMQAESEKKDYISQEFLRRVLLTLKNLEGKNLIKFKSAIPHDGRSKELKSIEETANLKSVKDKICLEFKEGSASGAPILSTTLKKITVVEPKVKGTRFLVILNNNYGKPIYGDKIKSWNLLYRIAKEKSVPIVEFKKADIDYFNSNKRNKIYTQSGYKLTQIFKKDVGYIYPNIEIDTIAEKAFKTRQNRLKRRLK